MMSSGVAFLTSGPKKLSPDTQDLCGPVFVLPNYGLSLNRKSGEKVKIKEFRYSSILKDKIAEGSKGTDLPLRARAIARASFGRIFSSFPPKD